MSGHVDGVAYLVDKQVRSDCLDVIFSCPASLWRCIARKGSVAVNGVSLTVHRLEHKEKCFVSTILPHTCKETFLGALRKGDAVNLEVDILARYMERLFSLNAPETNAR